LAAANGPDSVIVGSSVCNQRVERFNLDINTNVTRQFSALFQDLEFEGCLDASNETYLFCLQYVHLSRINRVLHQFIAAHNHHAISSEESAMPLQLFHAYQHLTELYSSSVHSVPYPVLNIQNLLSNPEELACVDVQARPCPLVPEKCAELQRLVNLVSQSLCFGRDLFDRTIDFVAQSLLE
jgi:hypothetical protein